MKREEEIKAKGKRQRAEDRVQSSEFRVQSSEFRACQNDIVGHVPGLKKFDPSAVSFAPESRNLGTGQAIDFIQQIKENTKREENIEYRISNIESGSCAFKNVSHSLPDRQTGLFLISYFLFLTISTVCLRTPLDPLKGSARIHKVLVLGFVCGISPLGVRGSAGIGMTTIKEISLVMRLAVQNRLALSDEANNLSIRQFDSLERISTVFHIPFSIPQPLGGRGWTLYQTNRQLGLPADKFYNN